MAFHINKKLINYPINHFSYFQSNKVRSLSPNYTTYAYFSSKYLILSMLFDWYWLDWKINLFIYCMKYSPCNWVISDNDTSISMSFWHLRLQIWLLFQNIYPKTPIWILSIFGVTMIIQNNFQGIIFIYIRIFIRLPKNQQMKFQKPF